MGLCREINHIIKVMFLHFCTPLFLLYPLLFLFNALHLCTFHPIHLSGTYRTGFSSVLHKLPVHLHWRSSHTDTQSPPNKQLYDANVALLSSQNLLHPPSSMCSCAEPGKALPQQFDIQRAIFQTDEIQVCNLQFASCRRL